MEQQRFCVKQPEKIRNFKHNLQTATAKYYHHKLVATCYTIKMPWPVSYCHKYEFTSKSKLTFHIALRMLIKQSQTSPGLTLALPTSTPGFQYQDRQRLGQ